jgi:aspartyl-tRNA(Asn)/glutamyl-tRNA(Gln) amidotransferase subunit A
MTGGSSGGCGAAVAGGLVPLAIGSDTNGSIRVPASLCGVFGLKPTYGRISRAGSFLFVASLDHLGPLARSTVDLALALDATAGHDPDDPVSMESDHAPLVRTALEEGAHGLRIARLGGYFERQGEPEAFDAVERVCRALDVTRRVEMPEVERARAAAFLISATEGGNLHLPRLRAQAADYDPDTRDRFIAGALAPAAWYVQAQRFRRWFRKRVLELFETVDVLIAPATPVTAPGLGQKTICVAGSEIPVRANLGIFTQPLSFVGLPVVTVPLQRRGALPIGVQIVAAPWREDRILRVAMALEARRVVAAWQVSFKG